MLLEVVDTTVITYPLFQTIAAVVFVELASAETPLVIFHNLIPTVPGFAGTAVVQLSGLTTVGIYVCVKVAQAYVPVPVGTAGCVVAH